MESIEYVFFVVGFRSFWSRWLGPK